MIKLVYIGLIILLMRFNHKKKNVLSLLLTLECIVLLTFIALCFSAELFFGIIFLRVGACEAAVGLGCLVGLIRLAGQSSIRLVE